MVNELPERTESRLKAVVRTLMLMAVAIALTDIVAYAALPNSIAWKFYEYRLNRDIKGAKLGYPQGYFVEHPSRGFDIGPDRRAVHEFTELKYSIWSNALGCFDRDWPNVPQNYTYFAGDSFTWGYTPYEQKFATLFEKATGKPSVKCGVSASGTRHQFEKFKEVTRRIGHLPSQVIVSFFSNDIGDDYVFPHQRIVDGWLVSGVFVDSKLALVKTDMAWTRQLLAGSLANPPQRMTCTNSLSGQLKCYSATFNVLLAARDSVRPPMQRPLEAEVLDYRGRAVQHSMSLDRYYLAGGKLSYRDNPVTAPHRATIAAWREHAAAHRYKLSLALIPPPGTLASGDIHKELREHLIDSGIGVVDLAQEFQRRGLQNHDVYWRYDGHLSVRGNGIVADVLTARWGK